MKNLNKLFGFVVLTAGVFGFTANLNAAATKVCTVTDDLSVIEDDCTQVVFSQNIVIADDLTIDGARVEISNNVEVTVTGDLVVKGYTTPNQSLTVLKGTNFLLGTGAKLIVKGSNSSVELDGTGSTGVIALQGTGSVPTAELVVEGGSVDIHDYVAGGIANFGPINLTKYATLTFDNNGYASNTAKITADDSYIYVTGGTNGNTGISSELVTTGNTYVDIRGCKILGLNLQGNTNIGEDTRLTVVNNGFDESIADADKRLTDIALQTTNAVISGNAKVTTGTIRNYFSKFGTQQGFTTGASLTVNGEGATLEYEEIIDDSSSSNGALAITVENGVVTDDDTNTVEVSGEFNGYIYVNEGQTLLVKLGSDLRGATIEAEGGATINNKSIYDIEVVVPDTYETVAVSADSEVTIETVNVYVYLNDELDYTYRVLKGSSLSKLDLFYYEDDEFTGLTFLKYVDENGNEVDVEKALTEDIKLYPVYAENAVNPNTGDNIITYVVLALMGLVAVSAGVVLTKKSF